MYFLYQGLLIAFPCSVLLPFFESFSWTVYLVFVHEYFSYVPVKKNETLLRHMQKDSESIRQWNLGKLVFIWEFYVLLVSLDMPLFNYPNVSFYSKNQVRCNGCKIWVHAECDTFSKSNFKVFIHAQDPNLFFPYVMSMYIAETY